MPRKTAKPARPTITTGERFARTVPEFRAAIADLAATHGRTVEEVYGWWLEYAAACYDQSPLLVEFERIAAARAA